MSCCSTVAHKIELCVFFKQKTAYEMRSSDWSSDVCSSDLLDARFRRRLPRIRAASAAMGAALWMARIGTERWLADSFVERATALAILVAIGLAVYAALAFGDRKSVV